MVRKSGTNGGAKTPKRPKKAANHQTVVAPVTFADDRTVVNQLIRDDNPVHKVEYARNLAYMQARLTVGNTIRSSAHSFEVLREVSRGVFSYKYEVKQRDGKRFFLRAEPLTENKTVQQFKSLKYELAILRQVRHLPHPTAGEHFPSFHDAGSTIDFKFIVTQALGDTLYDITRKHMKSGFSMSTAVRVAIQLLRAIRDLHELGFLHRKLKPEVFAVGRFSKIRNVYFTDFGEPFTYRDPVTKKHRSARKKIRIIGVLRYMSRNAQLGREHGRRDDMESWAYLTMEFFDLAILPWRDDEMPSTVLDKKQKCADGAFPAVFATVSMRYKKILRYITNMKYQERPDYNYLEKLVMDIAIDKNLDLSQPYDWELLPTLRDIIGKDPANDDPDTDIEPKDPIVTKPKKKKSKSATSNTVMPATVPNDKSGETESSEFSQKVPVLIPVPVKVKKYLTKLIDVEMSGDCLNQLDKFYKEFLEESPMSASPNPPKSPRPASIGGSKPRTPKREQSEESTN